MKIVHHILLLALLLVLSSCIKSPEEPNFSPLGAITTVDDTPKATLAFSVYGLSGLTSGSLKVSIAGIEIKSITTDGVYVFQNQFNIGSLFSITLDQTETSTERSCSTLILDNTIKDSGNSFEVNCAPNNEYFIGGQVYGLTSGQLKINISGTETKRVYGGETAFQFASTFTNATYTLSINQQPTSLICSFVDNGANQSLSGANLDIILSGANISNVKVLCAPPSSSTYSITMAVNGLSGPAGSLILKDSRGTTTTVTNSSTTVTLTNIPENKRILIEIDKSTSSNFYCEFDTNESLWGTTLTSNITGPVINCYDRNLADCQVPSGDWPGTNGTVTTTSCSGDNLIYDGTFTQFGYPYGLLSLDTTVANPSASTIPYDRIKGKVNKIIKGPSGGWLLGGNFTKAGDVTVQNFVRLDENFLVDTSFNLGFDGEVFDIDLKDNTLFVTGAFANVTTSAGTAAKQNIAQINIASTPALTSWSIPIGLRLNNPLLSSGSYLTKLYLEDNYAVIPSLFYNNNTTGSIGDILTRRSNTSVLRINLTIPNDFSLKILSSSLGTIDKKQMALWKDITDGKYWLVASSGEGIFDPTSPTVKHAKSVILGTTLNSSSAISLDGDKIYHVSSGLKVADLSSATPSFIAYGKTSGGVAMTESGVWIGVFDSTRACFAQKTTGTLINVTTSRYGAVCFDKASENLTSFAPVLGDEQVNALYLDNNQLLIGTTLLNPSDGSAAKPLIVTP